MTSSKEPKAVAAFSFNIEDDTELGSKDGTTCMYNDGNFIFPSGTIPIGNSYENNSGGIGGFVGGNHEWFLYCGAKTAEVALARRVVKSQRSEPKWKELWSFQPEGNCDGPMFNEIWTGINPNHLFFKTSEEFGCLHKSRYVQLKMSKKKDCTVICGVREKFFIKNRKTKMESNCDEPMFDEVFVKSQRSEPKWKELWSFQPEGNCDGPMFNEIWTGINPNHLFFKTSEDFEYLYGSKYVQLKLSKKKDCTVIHGVREKFFIKNRKTKMVHADRPSESNYKEHCR